MQDLFNYLLLAVFRSVFVLDECFNDFVCITVYGQLTWHDILVHISIYSLFVMPLPLPYIYTCHVMKIMSMMI